MNPQISIFLRHIFELRNLNVSRETLLNIKTDLNQIIPKAKCINVIFTKNTDNLPFGCIVFPRLETINLQNFLISGSDLSISEYEIEIDSKMFDYGMTDEEVASVMLFNIYHLVKDKAPSDRLREAIDDYFTKEDCCLNIKLAIRYQSLLIFGLQDALHQITSCFHLPDDIISDPFLDSLGLDNFQSALKKIYREIPGCENEVRRATNLSMLTWCLRLYTDIDTEIVPALKLLEKIKHITGSSLYITRCENCIRDISRIYNKDLVNESYNFIMNEASRKGLINNLKYSGLRSIEDDLYEFKIRAENAYTEYDVIYALKQINARLSLLDDYIYNNPDESDIERWKMLKYQYMSIRDTLAKKKLVNRNYSIFIDYDKLYSRNPNQ